MEGRHLPEQLQFIWWSRLQLLGVFEKRGEAGGGGGGEEVARCSGRGISVSVERGRRRRRGRGWGAGRLELCGTGLCLSLTGAVFPVVSRHPSYGRLPGKQDAWGANIKSKSNSRMSWHQILKKHASVFMCYYVMLLCYAYLIQLTHYCRSLNSTVSICTQLKMIEIRIHCVCIYYLTVLW